MEVGENIVGSCLRFIFGCEIVVYNQKIFRQGEVDVIGFDLDKKIMYICEVTTHIMGAGYGSGYKDTIERIEAKFIKDIKYSKNIFPSFKKVYMYWSPIVNRGVIKLLEKYKSKTGKEKIDFRLIINNEYTKYIDKLMDMAKKDTKNSGELFYRVLQILGHLKKLK